MANSVAPLLRFISRTSTKMVAKEDPVIDLVEEEEEEWPEVGVQNPEEVERYTERINNVIDHLSTLIHEDTKTALAQTIQNFKKIVARQWESMGDTDVDIISSGQ